MNGSTDKEQANSHPPRGLGPLFPEYSQTLASRSAVPINRITAPGVVRNVMKPVSVAESDESVHLEAIKESGMSQAPTGIVQELEAIKTVTNALQGLDANAQKRVIEYAMRHLKIEETTPPTRDAASGGRTDPLGGQPVGGSVPPRLGDTTDIRAFKEQRDPRSDVQMAVVVAYYLAELAPEGCKKDTITTADVLKYFKQAGYELPAQPKDTLPHAKTAGYLESAGHGEYRLTPVGHNLVAHNLPNSASEAGPLRRTRRNKKATPKRTGRGKGR